MGMDTTQDELTDDIIRLDDDLEELQRWIEDDIRSGYGEAHSYNT